MTDRGAAPSDRAPACPFVAFDDDREERADRPDHRHRCYAEVRPAPRAIAHQETYCLSPRFPACPTFQDWARREAAQARGGARGTGIGRAPAAADAVAPADADLAPATGDGGDALAIGAAMAANAADDAAPAEPDLAVPDPYDDDLAPRGRPQRDWAAPPPWLGRPAAGSDAPGGEPAAAAGLATSRWLTDVRPGDAGADDDTTFVTADEPAPVLAEAVPRPELVGLAGQAGRQRRPARESTERGRRDRPTVGQARPQVRGRGRERDRDDPTPAWERPHPFEAYPSIRSRVVLPSVPRIALGVVALVVAAGLLFLLPALFFSKDTPAAVASASPTAAPSLSLAPTASPKATPLTYTVKAGDTLIKIANKFKVTQNAILKANPTLKNANLIAVGQVLVIPTPPPPDVITSSSAPSASPSAAAP